jgi:RNase P/RNase MRP subunit p29
MINKEFIGKKMKIIKSKNKSFEGFQGFIIDETKNFFVVESGDKIKKVPKKGNVFEFFVYDKRFEIDGNLILESPENRIKFKV